MTPGGYQGLNFGLGSSVGPMPVELHTMVEYSDIIFKANLKDTIVNWLRGIIGLDSKSPCE